MTMSEELDKLGDLHQRGILNDDEFARAKARLLAGREPPPAGSSAAPFVAQVNALRRSVHDRWVSGVCGGLARATGMESWVWRLLFAVLAFFGGVGVVTYLLLWIFVPQE